MNAGHRRLGHCRVSAPIGGWPLGDRLRFAAQVQQPFPAAVYLRL